MKLPISLPGGRRSILVLGIPLGLAAAGALVFTQMSAGSAPAKVPDPGTGQLGPMLALDSKTINLSPTNGSTYKYAKIAVTIELRPADAGFYDLHGADRTKSEKTELEKYTDRVPLLLDALGTTVAAQNSTTLNSADGRAKLKQALLDSFRQILGDDAVLAVFITDFTMQ